MARKQQKETQKQQSERFKRAVQEMIDAGELSPTEADNAFSKLVHSLKPDE